MKWPWDWDRDPVPPSSPEPAPILSPPTPAEDELARLGPIELGERAETLLRDPLLRFAFARVRADLMERWLRSKADQREEREHFHQMIVGLDNVENELKRLIRNKQIAEHNRAAEDAATRRVA